MKEKRAVKRVDLSQRKKNVLAAVVKYHIETGEPIGSKILMALLPNSPSSATLRNEMNELCRMGYLDQPHPSAGRVPTSRGYRLYVNSLMSDKKLSDEIKNEIDERLNGIPTGSEGFSASASKILSDITGLPSIYGTVEDSDEKVKDLEVIPITAKTYSLVAVTTDGRMKTAVMRSKENITEEALTAFRRTVREKIKGYPLTNFTPAFFQCIIISHSSSIAVMEMLSSAADMLTKLSKPSLYLSGELNLYSIMKENQVKNFLSLFQSPEELLGVLKDRGDSVNVIFGEDTELCVLHPSAVVVASYGKIGRIGIIGPTRMSYDRIIPGVEYFASRLNNMINETLED